MTNIAYLPAVQRKKLEFVYDFQGRRVQKVVWTWNESAFGNPVTNKYLYDGWTVVAVLGPQSSVIQRFLWGQDLSGTLQGAGGVGGLVAVFEISDGEVLNVHFPCYDGNGNVMALVAQDGSIAARYESGPFGEAIRATGPAAATLNPFRFSTKRTDPTTDLVLYEYRAYSPSTGRWLSRAPRGEPGFDLVFHRPKSRDEALVERVRSALDSLQAVEPRLIAALNKRLGRIGFDA